MKIKTLSTTKMRENISEIISLVHSTGRSFVVGRRDNPEAVLIPFPKDFNPKISEITNINAYSKSFSFLKKEPELYSKSDLKEKYA